VGVKGHPVHFKHKEKSGKIRVPHPKKSVKMNDINSIEQVFAEVGGQGESVC